MDVGSRHYPGWQGLMKYDNYFRPVLFDEALHINSYNTSENITDPGLRDLWGDYVKYFSDQMEKAPAVAGIGLWSAIDEMFYPQKHSPCGYGPWGIIDGFRRPKPEYWHVKMAFSPVQVLSRNFHSIENQTTIWLENRYNVSDLNTLDMEKGVSFLLANYSCAGNESYLRFDSDRTHYASELKMDGGDVAGWLLIYCGD